MLENAPLTDFLREILQRRIPYQRRRIVLFAICIRRVEYSVAECSVVQILLRCRGFGIRLSDVEVMLVLLLLLL